MFFAITNTIKDIQVGSHCSDTCLSLFQSCFVIVFSVELSKFEANIERNREEEVAHKEHNTSTLFLQLTQVLMSRIAGALRRGQIITIDERNLQLLQLKEFTWLTYILSRSCPFRQSSQTNPTVLPLLWIFLGIPCNNTAPRIIRLTLTAPTFYRVINQRILKAWIGQNIRSTHWRSVC